MAQTTCSGKSFEDTWAFRLLLAGAFVMGFSMPAGRLCIALSLLLIIVGAIRGKLHFVMPASGWLWLGLVTLAGVVSAYGINPDRSLGKLDKLGWYLGIPVAATLVTTKERLRSVCLAIIGGMAVLSLLILARNILSATAIVRRFAGSANQRFFQFGQELAMQGSLIDGERLMIGFILALVLILGGTAVYRLRYRRHQAAVALLSVLALLSLSRNYIAASAIAKRFHGTPLAAKFPFPQELLLQKEEHPYGWVLFVLFGLLAIGCYLYHRHATRRRVPEEARPSEIGRRSYVLPLLPCALAGIAIAELLVLKRGSWFSTLAVVGLLLIRRISWKWLAAGGAILLAIALLVAPVRTRLADIPKEFDPDRGGRATMWLGIAPALVQNHPWGIGFRSLEPSEDSPYSMQAIADRYDIDVQIEKNRDHLHSNLVEMTTSLGWEGLLLYLVWMGVIFSDALRGGKETSPVFWAIFALFLNGFVEYNFADAEIIIMLGVLAGLAAAGRRMARQPAEAPAVI